jgi:hypothetical protein
MNLPIKKGWLIAIGIITALIITNPDESEFNNYLPDIRSHRWIRRDVNFFVFSIYRYGEYKYLGIAKNFIYLKTEQ